MYASVENQQWTVNISPEESKSVYFDRRIIGDRYSSIFGLSKLPRGLTAEGKLSIGPLDIVENDVSGLLSVADGKLTWGLPRVAARLDGDDDLALFVSDSFFFSPRGLSVIEATVLRSEVNCRDLSQVDRIIPALGVCLRRIEK